MAKKSAASKGYRKTIKKKPFLTKNEIIILIAIVAAIILGVILFNMFYGTGYLKLRDLQPDDVVASVSKEMRDRYVKVADAKELAGFTRTDPDRSSSAVGNFIYEPDAPTDHITTISLGGSFLSADELSNTSMNSIQSFNSNNSMVTTERSEVTVQGHKAYLYAYTNNYYQSPEDEAATETAEEGTEEETPESNVFVQSVSLYVEVDGNYTICLHIYCTGEDDSYYLADDELADFIVGYADQMFTVVEQEAEASA